jgi:hypothetical protein
MIWWKGRGWWVALLVAGIIAGAQKALGNSNGLPVGALAAAVAAFLVSDKESSFFSIPVRFFPPLLVLIAIVGYFKH